MLKSAKLNNVFAQLQLNKQASQNETEPTNTVTEFKQYVRKLASENASEDANTRETSHDANMSSNMEAPAGKEKSRSATDAAAFARKNTISETNSMMSGGPDLNTVGLSGNHSVDEIRTQEGGDNVSTGALKQAMLEAIQQNEFNKQAAMEQEIEAQGVIKQAFLDGYNHAIVELQKTAAGMPPEAAAAGVPAPAPAPAQQAIDPAMIAQLIQEYAAQASVEEEQELLMAIREILEGQGQAPQAPQAPQAAPQAPQAAPGMQATASVDGLQEDEKQFVGKLAQLMEARPAFNSFIEKTAAQWVVDGFESQA